MTSLTESQNFGRAKNAIGNFFDRKLVVPKIFFDADWDGSVEDILAIDRAGVGDVHVTALTPCQTCPDAYIVFSTDLQALLVRLLSRRCQYRYIALRTQSFSAAERNRLIQAWDGIKTFAEDGIGRVGLLILDISAGEPEVHQIIKAERFRSTKEILALTDAFVQTHTADMEYRDPVYDQEVSA